MSTTVVSFILVQVYYHNLHSLIYRICASEHLRTSYKKKKKKKSNRTLAYAIVKD